MVKHVCGIGHVLLLTLIHVYFVILHYACKFLYGVCACSVDDWPRACVGTVK